VDLLFQQLPFYPSSSEPETVDDEEEEEDDDEEDSESEENSDISSWVQAQVAKGADISTVLDALRYTSMEPVLAKKLLKILVAGEPVPENMRGVWTEEDDRCLESQDARDVERVTKKHGDRLFQARWEYLEMARERGLVR
jgi:telomeric repeat-binding factor 2-interacting protein 1